MSVAHVVQNGCAATQSDRAGPLKNDRRVTMLGLSRWSGPGGSYRTGQRFFNTVLAWAEGFGRFFAQHLYDPEETYLLVRDESVVTKAGHATYGLDYFFSGLRNHVVPGLAIFTLPWGGGWRGKPTPYRSNRWCVRPRRRRRPKRPTRPAGRPRPEESARAAQR
jgi:hypothetical protein